MLTLTFIIWIFFNSATSAPSAKTLNCECGKIPPKIHLDSPPDETNTTELGEYLNYKPQRFTWMAKVYMNGVVRNGSHGLEENIFCSAVIISDRVLLTADHCIKPSILPQLKNPLRIIVEVKPEGFMGAHANLKNLKEVGATLHVGDPPIGFITLHQPLEFNANFAPVCLPELNNTIHLAGRRGMLTGWGSYNPESEGRISYYHSGTFIFKLTFLEILPQTNCEGIHDLEICTRTLKSTKDYPYNDGESGGPLTLFDNNFKHTIVGVSKKAYGGDDRYIYGAVANVLNILKEIDDLSKKAGAKYCKK